MPWGVVSLMSLRQEFVRLSESKAVSFTELCQRYGISRKTGYKWLGRYRKQGTEGLIDQSRRPKNSPGQLSRTREQIVLGPRQSHPRWGARKIRRLLPRSYCFRKSFPFFPKTIGGGFKDRLHFSAAFTSGSKIPTRISRASIVV